MEIAGALEKIVGPERFQPRKRCQCYQFNCFTGKDWLQKPEIVVLQRTPGGLGNIESANRYKVPVTPKGGQEEEVWESAAGGILLDYLTWKGSLPWMQKI